MHGRGRMSETDDEEAGRSRSRFWDVGTRVIFFLVFCLILVRHGDDERTYDADDNDDDDDDR